MRGLPWYRVPAQSGKHAWSAVEYDGSRVPVMTFGVPVAGPRGALAGVVAAGAPIEAIEDQETIGVPPDLVPRRGEATELHDLQPADRRTLVEEIARASRGMDKLFRAEKINIGMLGNRVRQFHVHVIARFKDDPAWPGPV